MRFMTDVSLRIYVPADHICTWRLINFDSFIGPCSSPLKSATTRFWSSKCSSVWILMQFTLMTFNIESKNLKGKMTRQTRSSVRAGGRACFGETNYNHKENVLFLGDCPLSFLFHIVFFFLLCVLWNCNSGLRQLQTGNYDGIVSWSRDVMQEFEDNNEFHGEGTTRR